MFSQIRSTAVAAGLLLGALVGFTAPVTAATFTDTTASLTQPTDVGVSWTVDFICSTALPCNGGGDPGAGNTIEGTATFTLTSAVQGASSIIWGVQVVLSNTSASGVPGWISALGFNTDPDAVMSDFFDSDADGIVFAGGDGSIPSYNTELCAWDGSNCQGGGNDHSMTAGTTNTMSFLLTTAGTASALMFSNFAIKVQGAGTTGDSFEMGGTIRVAPVPLPAAGGLLLAGLAGLALLKRKRRHSA